MRKTLPFWFGPILITSCSHRKDTRLSAQYIFAFQECLGMRLEESFVAQSFSTCANLKCTCTFVSVRSIEIFGIWPHVRTQTYIHTHMSCNAVPLVWGSLSLAPMIRLTTNLWWVHRQYICHPRK